ncbi:MAG: BCCT family transporter [Gammaproteobacteria bacterium]|nr:BCCT family transporter [Gammaproteobacteria bacterium]MYK37457.1 BCCT family transporter [Gammaproteobacteria bacterium]
MPAVQVDRVLFWAMVAVIVAWGTILLGFPEFAGKAVDSTYSWIAGEVGVVYQWAVAAATIVLAVIALGRYGRYRLGGKDARPAYSTFSWVAMLFCTGIGGGLLYWAPIEWVYYADTPPFGLEPGSAEALEVAPAYAFFHWGISAWALYALATVAIAYPYYQRKVAYLRLSTSLVGLMGHDVSSRPLGRVVDFIFVVAMVGGTATSLSLATPMVGACISALFGIGETFAIDVGVIAISVALFATSVYLGIDKGIKRFSEINAIAAIIFAIYVLLTGPTGFALKLGTSSFGLMIQEFVRMSTWTDPILSSNFIEDWTIFYWAWWLAYAPFVGLFVTRISRGRSLRQVIGGMLLYGTLGCALFFVCIGNTAQWMDTSGELAVREILAADGPETAIAGFLSALKPFPLPLLSYVALTFIFIATTYDSASYAIAASATRGLTAGLNPHRWHRVFWALAIVVLPIGLIFVGGLQAAKSASLVVSLPLLVIGVAMTVSLFRLLREDRADLDVNGAAAPKGS